MRIKVFQAATMKDAMAQVKEELGDDAVILHTKKIKRGGILGYGAKEIFEVTAALDEVPRRPPKKRAERLPTLAELQAKEAGEGKTAKSSVPLPQGHAGASPAAPNFPAMVQESAPVSTMAPVTAPLPPVQTRPMQQMVQKQKPLLSQSAARSYKTAGTEAAIAEAEKQAYEAAPVSAPLPAPRVEPFVPAFPPGETVEKPALSPPATESLSELPVRKVRRKKPTVPKRKKPHATNDSPRKSKREKPQDVSVSQEKVRQEDDSVESRPKSDEARQRETIEALQNELAQMKAMLVQVVSKEKTPEDEVTLQQALKQQEVEPDIIDDVVLQLPAESILADKDTPLALDSLTKYLADNVPMADGLELKSRKRKIAALLGPTGVGKTTTLAKIAAQCVLEKGISTAFITADTYRISAVEQLKTYADILGLPIAIVYTPDELKEAIQKFRQKQLILIDTAGRSQHNRRQMAELKDFLAVNQNIEKYLVLSATTKNEDAKDIMDKFSVCKPDKVIFTKTDETKSLGVILNILRKKTMRLSYLTNGQSVPDDIVPAQAGKLAELFLR